MSSFFSEYVRSLGPRGEPPDPENFGELLDQLGGALVHEMKKRSLWSAPPSYLGIYGGARWTDEGVLEELLFDCYEFTFIRRLQGLQNQLSVRRNIDGLIFLNIRHFLYEVQKRYDPLGFRTFEVLQQVLSRLLERGVMHLLAGDPKVRNDTVLGFTPFEDPQTARDIDLRSQVIAWNNELLPEMITAWNREPTLAKLQTLIVGLPATGVEVFQFRDLIEPMKDDVRGRWHAIQLAAEGETTLQRSGGDLVSIVRWVRPELHFEHRRSYQELLECVAESLEKLEARAKTKEYLHRLWLFLRGWAAESSEASPRGARPASMARESERSTQMPTLQSPGAAREPSEAATPQDLQGGMPSDKKLSELLRIPRGRIPNLKATLGDLVKTCQNDILGTGPVIKSSEEAQSEIRIKGLAAMDLKRRREDLRLETGKAARAAAEQAAPAEREGRQSQPGDRFVFAETRAYPVEWVLLERDPADPGRALVVPIDDHPLVGSRDVAVATGGAAIFRCGLGTWLDARALDPERRVGVVEDGILEHARHRLSEAIAGTLRPTMSEREVDAGPEYRSWMRMLAKARAVLPGSPRSASTDVFWEAKPSTVIPFERSEDRGRSAGAPTPWRDHRVAYALAATFFAATVGLSFWVGRLRIERSVPVLVPAPSPDAEIVLRDPDRVIRMSTLTATASHVVAYLILAKVDDYPAYRVELLERQVDDVLWTSGEMAGDSQFILALPRGLLTAGAYRLRLYGRDEAGAETFLEEREIRIVVEQ